MKYFLKTGFMFLILYFCRFPIIAQKKSKTSDTQYKALKVGDNITDYKLSNLTNYPAKTANLSDFKGKLLILDYWDSHCTSCIEAWPEMLSLQKEFEAQLQILLVNAFENEATVKKIFDARKKFANVNMTFPSICGDTIIQKLFPHSSVPHVVWIDKNGIVKEITDQFGMNSKNIKAVLNAEPVIITQKIDNNELIRFAPDKPLFLDGNGGIPKEILSQSTFAKAEDRLSFSFGVNVDEKQGYSIYGTNMPITDLYALAYSNRIDEFRGLQRLLPNRVVLRVKDSLKYVAYNREDQLQYNNLYTYQYISSRQNSVDELQKIMQSDLKRYIGLNVHWEKREMKCLVLTALDTSLIMYQKGNVGFIVARGLIVNKVTVSHFIQGLELFTRLADSPYPIIDETNFKGLLGGIDEGMGFNVANYKNLDRALQKYKMRLMLQERTIDVLIIEEP